VTIPVTNAVAVVRRVGPAVVEIIHQLPSTTDLFGGIQPGGTAIGSGFIIDKRGYIVTNNHVISGGNNHFTVVFANGRRTSATLVGANPSNDIAVIRAKGPMPAAAHFGNSAYLQPGEPVVAIGDALGQFQNTVTSGIVSGLHRNVPGVVSQDMIQTDAAINHGNSGGPLVDLNGDVVGINTAIERSTSTNSSGNLFGSTDPNSTVAEGLGFAIPASTAAPLAQHIIRHVPPGLLGVRYIAVPLVQESYGVPPGARVTNVQAGSPAASAGLRAGDVIVGVNSTKLTNAVTLEQAIVVYSPNDTVTLTIWRPSSPGSHQGRTLSLSATLARSQTQIP
jgi:S1-C subfamily serine protease